MAKTPPRYINRELSWCAFNNRVLEEAMDPTNPRILYAETKWKWGGVAFDRPQDALPFYRRAHELLNR